MAVSSSNCMPFELNVLTRFYAGLDSLQADRSPIRPSTRNGSDNRSAPRNRSRSGSSSRSRGSPSGGLRDRASPSSAAANSRESSASPSRRRYDDGDNGEEHHSMDSGAMEDQADD